MERHILLSVIVLLCINVMDSIMGAVVSPTLIFYVTELGGSKEQYGMICSTVALSAMIMIPLYGNWVDSNGNKYTVPYMTSFLLGILASLLYFLAVLLPKGPIAIYSLMFSRFLDGASIAGRTLSYSWVASTIPVGNHRVIFTLLSSSRTLGMIIGPLANFLVSNIDTKVEVFGVAVPITPNNSVGLFTIFQGIILIVLTLAFFHEPPSKKEKPNEPSESGIPDTGSKTKGVWYALTHFNIFFPVFTMFTVVCNYMLPGTAFSPVARNMGWTPVDISVVSAYGSAVMALGMVLSMVLSMKSISDTAMISFGFGTMFVSGLSMYVFWTEGVGYWQFTLPLYLLYFSYPFIGPANRSRFTSAVHANKELEGSHGIMMSLINQAAAVAGFVSPSLVASLVLRNQEDISASSDPHQMTARALYVAVVSALILVVLLVQDAADARAAKKTKEETEAEGDGDADSDAGVVSEVTALLPKPPREKVRRASVVEISDSFSRSSEVNRRMSVEIMGIPNPVETKFEKELGEKLLEDKQYWEELARLADEDDDDSPEP
mmetsp:Transcript_9778/g.29114  ORF Transcript_9778/g.29114 Transcript_9778/m.29114 type:complete len:548 (-) Transcript_9778:652-2295(-)